jgi:hypothetical protein
MRHVLTAAGTAPHLIRVGQQEAHRRVLAKAASLRVERRTLAREIA